MLSCTVPDFAEFTGFWPIFAQSRFRSPVSPYVTQIETRTARKKIRRPGHSWGRGRRQNFPTGKSWQQDLGIFSDFGISMEDSRIRINSIQFTINFPSKFRNLKKKMPKSWCHFFPVAGPQPGASARSSSTCTFFLVIVSTMWAHGGSNPGLCKNWLKSRETGEIRNRAG